MPNYCKANPPSGSLPRSVTRRLTTPKRSCQLSIPPPTSRSSDVVELPVKRVKGKQFLARTCSQSPLPSRYRLTKRPPHAEPTHPTGPPGPSRQLPSSLEILISVQTFSARTVRLAMALRGRIRFQILFQPTVLCRPSILSIPSCSIRMHRSSLITSIFSFSMVQTRRAKSCVKHAAFW